ncbi:MAG: APC family permease [Proteobacteria bacterium]|nr:APC family permease [Pseudomonadota bacterium]
MLKREISATNVLIAAAGGMIGSGWLFSPFLSAQIAGGAALISWIIAGIFMLLIALPLCELGAMIPISGGMANYPTFTHGKQVGFLFAWISWLSYVVMTPIEIQAILQYASHFLPILISPHSGIKLSGYGYLAAVLIMLVVVVLNSFGIKLLAECNKYASLIKFAVPAITIISLLSIHHDSSGLNLNLHQGATWTNIFSALALGGVAFGFTGFQNGLMLAGEVKNPQKNIPIAILGAVGVGFLLYFFLQLSFILAVPKSYLTHGWAHLTFPGDSGPLAGLTLMLGMGWVATLLMLDAAYSPFGTTLVYTAATSRILYGMAANKHLPAFLMRVNRFKIPTVTLYINFLVGALAFLPFPGWQKMVAFLSSMSILSYGIGPICLLALRKTQAQAIRPFKLTAANIFCYLAFYACNLMLIWCSFEIIWKLYLAVVIGLVINVIYQRKKTSIFQKPLYWFFFYLTFLLLISYLSSFGGISLLRFPIDLIVLLPFSIIMLWLSQKCIVEKENLSDGALSTIMNETEPNG